MKSNSKLTRYLPALLACFLPLSAWAGTIQIEAKKMTLLQKESKVEFTGKVHLTRDTMQMDCDHLVAYYSDHQLTHADADGHVVIVQDKVHGHSNKARLDQIKGILTLTGQAVLEQQGNRVEGETIVHNLNSQKTVVTPDTGGRIHMTIESEDNGAATTILPGKVSK
ncbi:lipopolysaccharide transport periplasmic protein LptA [Mariprofundus ferrooxydans]|uniref:Possible OstA-like protein n=1 Tax=Mariprofundus ferrooxydans PV-1 TaxID=314345 RepID=Q0EXN8_9PROT|nr:lipopolysaccharide transport periplasmic protein LptA [Mariprofundus ferrooxydans]EAU54009.1 possible OstA-like protein [Mariprofundus ferrooxydans PV-1]KON46571.1 OstA protein [Mariprofundus ferrooxydans]